MNFPIVSDKPWVQAHYEHCRAEGTSHALAEMFALGQPPMSNTDREFLEGRCNGNQFEGQDRQGDFYKQIAQRHGQNVTGKVYLSGLARFPGDPEAWVSGRGDAQRVVEQRGWNCDGSVKVRAAREHEPVSAGLADDLVERLTDQRITANPDLARKDRAELKEETKAIHQPT